MHATATQTSVQHVCKTNVPITENPLTTPKPCTKKPSIKAVTIVTCLTMSHATRNSSHGRTIQETFFGTIHLSARMSKRMLESAFFLLINTSLNQTLFTKF